jgi:hypothetical protein
MMEGAEWAAWAAVGSILAIAAGFILAARERRIAGREQQRRDLWEAKAIAGLIQADVLVWKGRFERIGVHDDVLQLASPRHQASNRGSIA